MNNQELINRIGIKLSKETKQKLSEQKIGEKNTMYGKKPSKESRKKMREASLRRIKRQGWLSYNEYACQFIDKLNKEKTTDRLAGAPGAATGAARTAKT